MLNRKRPGEWDDDRHSSQTRFNFVILPILIHSTTYISPFKSQHAECGEMNLPGVQVSFGRFGYPFTFSTPGVSPSCVMS